MYVPCELTHGSRIYSMCQPHDVFQSAMTSPWYCNPGLFARLNEGRARCGNGYTLSSPYRYLGAHPLSKPSCHLKVQYERFQLLRLTHLL